MLAERASALEQQIIDELGIREIGTFGLERWDAAGIWGPGFPQFGDPWVVVAAVILAITRDRACSCWRWMREVRVEHGDEVIGDILAKAAVERKALQHCDAMFEEKLFVVQGLASDDCGECLTKSFGFFEIEMCKIVEDGRLHRRLSSGLTARSSFGICLAIGCFCGLLLNGSEE